MPILVVLAALAAEPATATGKPRLVVLDLTPGGVDAALAQSLSEALAAEAAKTGRRVTLASRART